MKTMLHMHQIRSFIDDRFAFYNDYVNGVDPRFYHFKGVQKAFKVGSAVDHAIKGYYTKTEMYNSVEFSELEKIDKVMCMGMVNNYMDYYAEREHFRNVRPAYFKVPLGNYILLASPDLIAELYKSKDMVIIEIKTGEKKEALDFQTMFYCWASWRWNFKIPTHVIKRTLAKPRIKLKKDESTADFIKRLAGYEYTINAQVREVTKPMVVEFEKYLKYILSQINLNNKYSFYRSSGEYYGTMS